MFFISAQRILQFLQLSNGIQQYITQSNINKAQLYFININGQQIICRYILQSANPKKIASKYKSLFLSQMHQRKTNRNISSSFQNNKNIQKKISEHIKEIVKQNNAVLSEKMSRKAEEIPQKIVEKAKKTHKYLYKKTLINTKFQWLNKYLQSSELQSLPIKIKPNHIRIHNNQNQEETDYQTTSIHWKKNNRSKTQGLYSQKLIQNPLIHQNHKQHGDKILFSDNQDKIFRERTLNSKIHSENHFRLKKSKSTQHKSNISGLDDEHLKRMLMDERKINRSNCEDLVGGSCSSKNLSNKQNSIGPCQDRKRMAIKIFIEQNTPVKQFLDCSARLNQSNLMLKNKSGYIKNHKKQYIYKSRQQKRQQSELLKIKKRFQEEISVEPWNLGGNEKEQNDENDFIMNKHC